MCKKRDATNSQSKVEYRPLGLTEQSIHPNNSGFAMGQPRIPQLADKIVALMESEGVSLADLLLDLEEERKAIWQERQADASQPNSQ